MTKMTKILIIRQKGQNLKNDQGVTNSDMISKSYKIKVSKVLIKHQKITKSEQWPKLRKFWSKVKNLQNLNNVGLKCNRYWPKQKVTKSEQWPKCQKFWSNIKELQNLNNDQNVANSDQRKKLQNLNNDQNVTNSDQR